MRDRSNRELITAFMGDASREKTLIRFRYLYRERGRPWSPLVT